MATSWESGLDPNELLDFTIEFVDRLAEGDTILSHTAEVASGTVEIDSSLIDGTDIVIWLTGGTIGESCIVTAHVTTTAGRMHDKSGKLKIKAK